MTEEHVLSVDELLDALADTGRRKLLLALAEQNPQSVAPPQSADSESKTEAFGRPIPMKHNHLPKLVGLGLIKWDSNAHEVVKGPNFDQLKPLLELLDDNRHELPEDWI